MRSGLELLPFMFDFASGREWDLTSGTTIDGKIKPFSYEPYGFKEKNDIVKNITFKDSNLDTY